MIYGIAAAIAALFYALTLLDSKSDLSPDGRFYTSHGAVPHPYCRRWLWPLVCGSNVARWQLLSAVSLIAWGPALAWYLEGFGAAPWQKIAGVVLLCGLPGMFRFNAVRPVLVDAPAFALALVCAALVLSGHPFWGAAVSLAAGASKESAPIFAAAFSLSPWPLVGLVAAGWWRHSGCIPKWAEPWLAHPVKAALEQHRHAWLNWQAMVLPLGVLLPLALCAPWGYPRAWALAGLCLALGYGQMLFAMDTARLYSWAAPGVIALALLALPQEWAPLIVAAHCMNPYRGA